MKVLKVVLLASVVALAGCSQVDLGEVGLKTEWGRIIDGPLKEGLYFYTWFGQEIITYNVKNQTLEMEESVFSKDVQEATIKCVIIYNLDPAKVIDLHKNTGIYYSNVLIRPNFSDTLKNVTGKWEATEMIGNREKLSTEIHHQIRNYLSAFGINIVKVNLTNVDFKDAFENAVEEKQIASQRALKAKNDTIRIKEEAEQKLISAKAEAEAMEVRAQALEKNKGLVEYEAVMKWNGVLPTYMMGNQSLPFISIGGLNK